MTVFRAKDFSAERAWDSLDIAQMNGISVRMHWTDQPYSWHVNDGQEVFAILDGQVQMHVRRADQKEVFDLQTGDVFFADVGCEHLAYPQGEARILVVEHVGSK
ncbi:cupin [Simplicispira psychrophila]|uniref:cupin n=1 Tax=Simplicispira psychrophila TaxID=80882 RepID=UPI0004809634|nr:cupin [Simplicispira psychrophila]